MLCAAQQSVPQAPPVPKPQPQAKDDQQKPQQPSDVDDIVKITTNLVQIDAIVTDSKGNRVTDLRADEVEMLEDGKVQDISNFSYVNLESGPAPTKSQPDKPVATSVPLPPVKLRPEQVRRTLALVVDDLGLSFESAYYVRRSLKKFVDEQMQPNDLVAIIRTGGGIGALQQFTSDKRQLYAAVEKVKWNPIGRGGVAAFAPIGSEPTRASDPENDLGSQDDLNQFREDLFAVGTLGALNYIVRGLKELPGRKSVVLFTDGLKILSSRNATVNDRVFYSLRRLIDFANRASVVIYTLDARGLQVLGLTAADAPNDFSPLALERQLSERRSSFYDSQMGLDFLSERTGGLAFKNRNDLSGIVKEILADQEGYYLIGYRPDESTFTPVGGRVKFHNVSLKIKRSGKYKVRMRNGFYGVSNEDIKTVATPQQQIVNALTSPFGASGVQLKLTSLFINDPKVGSAMHSILHVNTKDIDFAEEPDGTRKAVVDVMALAFGDNGVMVDQFSYTQTLSIKKESFAKAVKNGITYRATIPIKKSGAYQFRIALRDRSSGRVGSASQFIEVPDVKKDRLFVSGIVMKGMTLESYMRNTGAASADAKNDDVAVENLPTASSALRQFQNGMALAYAYSVYNAQIDKATGKPKLKIQVRVFRNGEELFTGNQLDYDSTDQKDMKRLIVTGGIQLGANMAPGEYVLQVIATDTVKAKPRVASQWLDFEIVQ